MHKQAYVSLLLWNLEKGSVDTIIFPNIQPQWQKPSLRWLLIHVKWSSIHGLPPYFSQSKCFNICDQIWENLHNSHILSHKVSGIRYMKLSEIVELLFYYHSWKFQICMPSRSFYWSPDAHNRMCEPCTFPKSGHIYSYHKQGMFILQGNSFMYVSHKHHYVYWQKSLSFCTYTSTVMYVILLHL